MASACCSHAKGNRDIVFKHGNSNPHVALFSTSSTCTARGPLGEGSAENVTRDPWEGFRFPTKDETWKKTRACNLLLIKPNPRESLYESMTPSLPVGSGVVGEGRFAINSVVL